MDVIVINGGKALSGSVTTSGSKNAALPLLFASLLAEGEHRFDNVPQLKDIDSTELLLNQLNCKTHRTGHQMVVTVRKPKDLVAPYDIVRKMRASILCLGPLPPFGVVGAVIVVPDLLATILIVVAVVRYSRKLGGSVNAT